jgi:hypothetical protein
LLLATACHAGYQSYTSLSISIVVIVASSVRPSLDQLLPEEPLMPAPLFLSLCRAGPLRSPEVDYFEWLGQVLGVGRQGLFALPDPLLVRRSRSHDLGKPRQFLVGAVIGD